MIIWVDEDQEEAALAALPGHNVIGLHDSGELPVPDLILSTKARYFEPEWFSDPKLVEVALKRARSEKKKRGKK